MRQVRGVTGVCVLLAMVMTAGCAAPRQVELPGENVTFSRYATQGDLHAAPEHVVEAAESVMALMQMDIGEVEEGAGGYALPGRTSTGRLVRITVEPLDEPASMSRLRVRIGALGDRQLSDELYRRIANRLE